MSLDFSDRTVALWSTQPLVKTNTRNIPGGKSCQCVRLTTSPPSRAERHEIWEPTPPGTLWASPGLIRDSLALWFPLVGTPILSETAASYYHFASNFTVSAFFDRGHKCNKKGREVLPAPNPASANIST